MDTESKIINVYKMIFDEVPDSDTYDSLILNYKQNNNSIDSVEEYLRNTEKFKKLSAELEKELEVAELYYNILERMPDKEGLDFYKIQLLHNTKSVESLTKEFKNSDEFKEKILKERKLSSKI
tara:strand:+ start:448 stop:816 length:369 start_codon:yes stop_codon:yes gene_type:complete